QLLRLTFKANRSGRLSESIGLGNEDLESMVLLGNQQLRSLTIEWEEEKTNKDQLGAEWTIAPNPFTSNSRLQWTQQKAQIVKIAVYQLDGQLLWKEEKYFDLGDQQYLLSSDHFPSQGLYWIQLVFDDQVHQEQLLHLK
ncbi:MAG: T9SS type A sorting domain-containing protein, partial [Bacteroidota bacterium]